MAEHSAFLEDALPGLLARNTTTRAAHGSVDAFLSRMSQLQAGRLNQERTKRSVPCCPSGIPSPVLRVRPGLAPSCTAVGVQPSSSTLGVFPLYQVFKGHLGSTMLHLHALIFTNGINKGPVS